MTGKIKYDFSAKMWKDAVPGGWYFVSLPTIMSKEIREHFKWQEEGWGRMSVTSEIENIQWKTAIWFDTKTNIYVLPIKAEIRKKGKLEVNKKMEVSVWV